MVPPKGDPACELRTPLHHHVVEPGEHLGLIAGRYGVRSKDVLALNPELRNPNLLRAGQRVRVCPELPPRERVEDSYVVQPGDTLSEIAERHDLAVAEVLAFNPALGADPNRVRAGQVLRFERDGEVLPAFRPIEVATGGVMTHAQRLPAGEGYLIKRAHNVWGTPRTIELLQRALATYRRAAAAAGPAVRIGDISRRGGGEFPPHLSHRDGRDVDVGYVLKGSAAHVERFVPARRDTLDVARSWRLIEAFLATGEVQMIFVDYGLQALLYEHARKQGMAESELDELFQYPRGKGRGHGIIRHWRSHDGHFHVRFRE
jgi:LysM repeat protein